jgi:hypothetical protein
VELGRRNPVLEEGDASTFANEAAGAKHFEDLAVGILLGNDDRRRHADLAEGGDRLRTARDDGDSRERLGERRAIDFGSDRGDEAADRDAGHRHDRVELAGNELTAEGLRVLVGALDRHLAHRRGADRFTAVPGDEGSHFDGAPALEEDDRKASEIAFFTGFVQRASSPLVAFEMNSATLFSVTHSIPEPQLNTEPGLAEPGADVGPDPVVGAGITLFGILMMGIFGAADAHYAFDFAVLIAVAGAGMFVVSVALSALKQRQLAEVNGVRKDATPDDKQPGDAP